MSTTAKNNGGTCRSADWPARKPVMPAIAADAIGPRSMVEHSTSEQYLDRAKADKIAPPEGHDLTPKKSNAVKPHFEPMPGTAQRAAPLPSDTAQPSSDSHPLKAGPSPRPEAVVGGRAGRARQTPPLYGLLSAYSPPSWHDAKGINKVVRKLQPRLPDVSGKLFVTFTLDRNFFQGPAEAFELVRKKIRKMFARLRKGVMWKGKLYQTDKPYCVKVEFHADEDGWPHFHVIQLTRRYIPGELLTELWGFGRPNIKRITNDEFLYMLKYATKGVGYPDWVLSRHRIRIFQASPGFLKPAECNKTAKAKGALKAKRKRASYTIGKRLERWARCALLNKNGRYRAVLLPERFQKLFDELVSSIAEEGRYLGLGLVKINHQIELLPWLMKQNQV
jgi:hypothetical protein